MSRGKRLDIQTLRAIAVAAVVVYHLWPNRLTGGFMGVDVFFVISGFLMTTTLMRDAQAVTTAKRKLRATGSFLASFYARRIKRLIPAAAVTLLGTLGLVLLTGNLALIQETARQITASALFFQNWFLANSSVDYLANTDPTAVQHFWSLSLEEQFYMVWPLLLLGLLLVTSNLYIFYKKKEFTSFAIIPIILIIAGFFAFGYFLTQSQPSLAYFVTPARVWELLLGALIAFLPVIKNYDLRLLLPWIGFAMIGYALYSWDGTNFPGWHALIPTLGTALIIYAGGLAHESKWSFEHIFRHRPIQWLGDVSYSLYLWHWPLIILLPTLFFFDLDKHPQSRWIKIGIVIASIILAWLSYKFVEQTTAKIKWKKRYIYIAFALVTATVGGLAYFTQYKVVEGAKEATQQMHVLALDDGERCLGARSITNNCDNSYGYTDKQFAQLGPFDNYKSEHAPCDQYFVIKEPEKVNSYCTIGDTKAGRTAALVGDSHLIQWASAFDKIGKDNNIRFVVFSMINCLDNSKDICKERRSFVTQKAKQYKPEFIVISTLSPDQERAADNINIAREISSDIFYIQDSPHTSTSNSATCFQNGLSCIGNRQLSIRDSLSQVDYIVKAGLIDKRRIIYTDDIFCDSTSCYSYIGGIPVYSDSGNRQGEIYANSHITTSFSTTTAELLTIKLKKEGVF